MSSAPKPKRNKKLSLVPVSVAIQDRIDKRQAIQDYNDACHSSIGNIQDFEHDLAPLLHQLCSLAENIHTIKLSGPEKKALVIEFVCNVLASHNNERDRLILSNLIDWIVRANLISRVSDAALVSHRCFSFLKKKVLA